MCILDGLRACSKGSRLGPRLRAVLPHDGGQTEAIQGTGLELSIVVAIVEAHGGSVEVESELGVGTKFRVVLPTARAERDDSDRRPTGRAEVARDPARGLDHRGAELPVAAAAEDPLTWADHTDRAHGFGAAVEDRRGNAALA